MNIQKTLTELDKGLLNFFNYGYTIYKIDADKSVKCLTPQEAIEELKKPYVKQLQTN